MAITSPPRAVRFGPDTLIYASNTDSFPGLPGRSSKGLVSFWFMFPKNFPVPEINGSPIIIDMGCLTAGFLNYNFNGDYTGQIYFNLGIFDSTSDGMSVCHFENIPIPRDGNWHHVIAAWSSTDGNIVAYLDNVLMTAPNHCFNSGCDAPPYGPWYTYSVPFTVPYDDFVNNWLLIGRDMSNMNGCLAEVYLNLSEVDWIGFLADVSNRQKFRDKAIGFGGTGWVGFGESIPPYLYMSGPPETFTKARAQVPKTTLIMNLDTFPEWPVVDTTYRSVPRKLLNAPSDPFDTNLIA